MQGFDELWLGDSILKFLASNKDLMQTVTRDGTSVFVAAVPGPGIYVACMLLLSGASSSAERLQVILSTTFCGGWSVAAMCFTMHIPKLSLS